MSTEKRNIKSERKYYLAKMYLRNGIYSNLKITMDSENIYFVRNENGVNAWHCGSLPKSDYRILEIKEWIN